MKIEILVLISVIRFYCLYQRERLVNNVIDDVVRVLASRSLLDDRFWRVADIIGAEGANLILSDLRGGIPRFVLEENPEYEGSFRCVRHADRLLRHFEDGFIGFPDDLDLPEVDLVAIPQESHDMSAFGWPGLTNIAEPVTV